MDANTVTLVVGLGGIVATLASSVLGLYFVAKTRSAPLREMVYSKQIDLIISAIHKIGRTRIFFTILAGKDPTYKECARDDLGICIKDISELTEKGAAILPTELWVELKKLSSHITSISVEYDEKETVDSEQLVKLSAMDAKVALIARSVLGVDELTEESIRISSSKKDFERLANMEVSVFEKLPEKMPNKPFERTRCDYGMFPGMSAVCSAQGQR